MNKRMIVGREKIKNSHRNKSTNKNIYKYINIRILQWWWTVWNVSHTLMIVCVTSKWFQLGFWLFFFPLHVYSFPPHYIFPVFLFCKMSPCRFFLTCADGGLGPLARVRYVVTVGSELALELRWAIRGICALGCVSHLPWQLERATDIYLMCWLTSPRPHRVHSTTAGIWRRYGEA